MTCVVSAMMSCTAFKLSQRVIGILLVRLAASSGKMTLIIAMVARGKPESVIDCVSLMGTSMLCVALMWRDGGGWRD